VAMGAWEVVVSTHDDGVCGASYNDGARRWTVMQPVVRMPKIGDALHAYIQYLGYIELAGAHVDLTALSGCQGVTPAQMRKREQRDGPRHHITLVSPPEMDVRRSKSMFPRAVGAVHASAVGSFVPCVSCPHDGCVATMQRAAVGIGTLRSVTQTLLPELSQVPIQAERRQQAVADIMKTVVRVLFCCAGDGGCGYPSLWSGGFR